MIGVLLYCFGVFRFEHFIIQFRVVFYAFARASFWIDIIIVWICIFLVKLFFEFYAGLVEFINSGFGKINQVQE